MCSMWTVYKDVLLVAYLSWLLCGGCWLLRGGYAECCVVAGGGSIDAEEFSSMIPLLGEVTTQHCPCMLLYSLTIQHYQCMLLPVLQSLTEKQVAALFIEADTDGACLLPAAVEHSTVWGYQVQVKSKSTSSLCC